MYFEGRWATLVWQAVIRAGCWCSGLTTGRDKRTIIVLEQLLSASLCVSALFAVLSSSLLSSLHSCSFIIYNLCTTASLDGSHKHKPIFKQLQTVPLTTWREETTWWAADKIVYFILKLKIPFQLYCRLYLTPPWPSLPPAGLEQWNLLLPLLIYIFLKPKS